ncbi:hypothetical protein CRN65_28500 (plasmid) [Klebsiella pneumoniae]|nr:hypothetical protein CRN65_28500 [Klebsiella pneumoniae]
MDRGFQLILRAQQLVGRLLGCIINICNTVIRLFLNGRWICPYISRHLLSLNPLLARCRRYSRGER